MKTDDEGTLQRPQLIWDVAAGGFRIQVPKRKPTANSAIEAGFDEDLGAFFGNRSSLPPPVPTEISIKTLPIEKPQPDLPQGDQIDLPNDDSSEDRLPETAPPALTLPIFSPISQENSVDTRFDGIPSVNDMAAKPTEIFDDLTPYFLVVDAAKIPLRVQASHQASLELIATYLRKWGRVNQNSTLQVRTLFTSD